VPRRAAHPDHLGDAEPEGQALLLQLDGAVPGQLAGGVRTEVAVLERDPAGGRVDVAGEHAEQRGLAGAVGPDQRDQLAGADVEVDVDEDRVAVDGDGDALGVESDHAQPPAVRRARRISQKKNGPPISAVSMPMGRSA
jgi:hypothetical protein